MYLEKGDLTTHLYPEIIETIARADDSLVNQCINIAVDEAKSYLMRFDLKKLFGYQQGEDWTEPAVEDHNLKAKVKDLVCWHLVKLANPNISMELMRTGYEDAIKFFENIKKGQLFPDGWPLKEDDPDTTMGEGNRIYANGNAKRRNHW